jgi:hypothetical protein
MYREFKSFYKLCTEAESCIGDDILTVWLGLLYSHSM